MPYDNIINRTGAASLIPAPVANKIFQGIVEESAVLRMATKLPNMTSSTLSLPILSSLPQAYFVNGDTGHKQTTNAAWENKLITAEEIAVVVPVPDNVLADSAYDIWGQIQPLVAQAFGQVIDKAILYGTNKPNSWPAGICSDAVTNNKVVNLTDDVYGNILGANGIVSMVEQSGYDVTGYIGAISTRGTLRDVRDDGGMPIFKTDMQSGTRYMLDGKAIQFPHNGAIDPTTSLLIAGDFSQLVYSIRQDMTVKLFTEGVVTDNSNNIIYNLMQQDMSALRFVMRLGWQLPNPVNNIGGATRYPFAVLAPAVPETDSDPEPDEEV